MSTADFPLAGVERQPVPRRVRDQAREVVVLMAFSALTSVALAGALVVLASVAGNR